LIHSFNKNGLSIISATVPMVGVEVTMKGQKKEEKREGREETDK
jgi:hypothetical protein